jgi:prevent-host-death family protein
MTRIAVASERYSGDVGEQISQRQLRNDNAEIMRRVEAGESFVVTRRGTPVADLVPHDPERRGKRTFVPTAELVATFRGPSGWTIEQFIAHRAEMNATLEGDRDPWE